MTLFKKKKNVYYSVEALQENGLFEEVEMHRDKTTIYEWFVEWLEDYPNTEFRMVKKEIIVVRGAKNE